jgi:polyketide synthase PksN
VTTSPDASSALDVPIAVVGISLRGGAADPIALRLVHDATDADGAGCQRSSAAKETTLADFDAGADLDVSDPQRVLELSRKALDHAGISSNDLRPIRTGVFVGVVSEAAQTFDAPPDAAHEQGLASHISSLLGLGGPSFVFVGGGSSALVAVHAACESLRRADCDLALAGGSETDGAAGMMVLKPLSCAVSDGDRVSCLIRAAASDRLPHKGAPRLAHEVAGDAGIAALLEVILSVAGAEPNPGDHRETPHLTEVTSVRSDGTQCQLLLSAYDSAGARLGSEITEPASASAVAWVLSARSPPGLRGQARRLRSFVAERTDLAPTEVGWSLATTRTPLEHRAAVIGTTREELTRGLDAILGDQAAAGIVQGSAGPADRRVVMVFPGQGSQWQGMAADLMRCSATFRAQANACVEAFSPFLELSLEDVLHGDRSAAELQRVDVVQPALFAVMVALTAVWRAWGVEPAAVVGHSLGEVAAAYVSGALSLDDAARVVALWSRAQSTIVGRGEMATVELSLDEVARRLAPWRDQVVIAGINGPRWILVSGVAGAVRELVAELRAEDIRARIINVGLAGHSPHVETILEPLQADLATIRPRPTSIPLYSSITGGILDGTALGAEYWCTSLRSPVQFEAVIRALLSAGYRTFAEVSPHPVLTMGVQDTVDAAAAGKTAVVVGSLRRNEDGMAALLTSLSELYVRGVPVDWRGVFAGRPLRRLRLPALARRLDAVQDEAPVSVRREADDAPTALCQCLADASEPEMERIVLDLVRDHAAVVRGHGASEAMPSGWAFQSMGLTSLEALDLRGRLATATGLELPSTLLFDHPTPVLLTRHLIAQLLGREGDATDGAPGPAAASPAPRDLGEPIAIVGMAGRVPGADDVEQYWQLIREGREAISFFDDEELAAAGVPDALIGDPAYVKARGVLPDVELFDAAFFGLTPAEAEMTDPQHRLFLQYCHVALEAAGYDPERHAGPISVYAGAALNSYLQHNVLPNVEQTTTSKQFEVMIGNDKDYLATRVSYKLNLRGASYTVQTACSSSLVAVHLACEGLRTRQCDMALAGGVAVKVPQVSGYLHEEGAIFSADGHVRTFDADATGTVFGNGVGIVVLKRLRDAVAEGDTIHAVIRGTATNNDGSAKVSYAGPSTDSQAAVVVQAHAASGVDPETITYVEAHGTATSVGDPIEVSALAQAFARRTAKRSFCAIGSIKANIGHLDAASGVVGVLKVALMMRHRALPPSVNFERPNPSIDFEAGPFHVNTEYREWTTDGAPLRAGVSSFGVGGTNAHLVLEEPPPPPPPGASRHTQLLILSAKTPTALESLSANLAAHLRRHSELALADVAFTLAVGRQMHEHRRALLCRDATDAARLLEGCDAPACRTGRSAHLAPSIAFAFPDAIDVDEAIAGELARTEPAFASRYEACVGSGALEHGPRGRAFAFQYAVAGLWLHWGLRPQAAGGQGVGEIVAACVAGAVDLTDAVALLRADVEASALRRREPRLRILAPDGTGDEHEGIVLTAGGAAPLEQLRDAWLAGAQIDWARVYTGESRRRIELPTYPFEGRRCWIEPPARPQPAGGGAARLHPLVDANVSTLHEHRYTALRTGEEFYLADHVILGKRVLPAVASLEMARAAGELAAGASVRAIRAVTFERMLSFDGRDKAVDVILAPGEEAVRFRIAAAAGGEADASHVRGELLLAAGEPSAAASRADVAAIERRCTNRRDIGACYERFRASGLCHGPTLRSLRELALGLDEALGVLELPESVAAGADEFVLHPSLLDGALQAVVGLLAAGRADRDAAFVPVALGRLEIHGRPGTRALVHVTRRPGAEGRIANADAVLLDRDGTALVQMTDIALRAPKDEPAQPPALFFRECWEPTPEPVPRSPDARSPYLLLATGTRARDALRQALADAGEHDARVVLVTPGTRFERYDETTYTVDCAALSDFRSLLAALAADGIAPRRVVHAWSEEAGPPDGEPEPALRRGIGSLLCLTKALLEDRLTEDVRLLFVHVIGPHGASPVHEAVAAFARTARLENPRLQYRVVAVPAVLEAMPRLVRELHSEREADVDVRHEGERRLVRRLRRVDVGAERNGAAALREGGVYLVTGGAGGLGLIFARHLVSRVGAHVVLAGRSDLAPEQRERIHAIAAAGGSVRYVQADVTKPEDVDTLLTGIRSEHGRLHGVIHAAGVTSDSFLLNKAPEELFAVAAPKVLGAVHLDRLTAQDELDLFVMFSSVAAPLGNVGQADYAYANAFLDAYAVRREALVASGQRSGRTLSIAWPLWQDGGMTLDEEAAAALRRRFGLTSQPTSTGLAAFDTALRLPGGALVVATGDLLAIPGAPTAAAHAAPVPASAGDGAPSGGADLRAAAETLLRRTLAAETRLDADDIDARAPLERYGIDSLVIARLNRALVLHFGELSKTLFFEYATLEELAGYFAANHPERLRAGNGTAPSRAAVVERPLAPAVDPRPDDPPGDGRADDAVAIIGVSGRYPMADDLDEFWHNLAEGVDCVTEVPSSRWDHAPLFDAEPRAGRAYTKWGGFLRDVERFDPLFFSISPREAELMDPQERLFLQTSWHVLEDAGYRRGDLADREVGVFVGVMYGEYQLYAADMLAQGRALPSSLHASIANRVSYALNLTGPSLAVDTMCSSSLTAIHLACESLRRGESDLAVAGGVNLSLHPYKYVYLSQGRFASADGRCRSFGAGGSGYVPGEGVGAVLLKPRRKALEDGDQIYGVILGHAVNHGGKTNGYTTPNPRAQAAVIRRALAQAGVRPAEITCVEAHGTGTSLGDPIEISGLKMAYGPAGEDSRACSLGSLKSNIGHLEAAAGIAGLTKVLLQFRHRQLAPSLHCEEVNPNITFGDSPLRLQRELAVWEPPSADGRDVPRRAGLSSFGAGGSNAHLILEEHEDARPRAADIAATQRVPEPLAFVLSARDEERLRVYAGRLGRFLGRARVALADVAYTLQTGREAMQERLAIVSRDGEELMTALLAFCDAGTAPAHLLRGRARERGAEPPDGEGLEALVRGWVRGAEVDWHALHRGSDIRRISLPGYPFARERYWAPTTAAGAATPPADAPHPLVDANESTLDELRFRKTFGRDDPLVRDHIVDGRRLLAGTACLEFVRAAAERAGTTPPSGLRDVVWGRPITIEAEAVDVYVTFRREGDAVTFEVFSERPERTTHVRGTAVYGDDERPPTTVDVDAIRRRCAMSRDRVEIYGAYDRAGFHYGPAFQVMQELHVGRDEVLAHVRLSADTPIPIAGHVLHPALLDGALRGLHWMNRREAPRAGDLVVPFSLGAIGIRAPLPAELYVHVTPARGGAAAQPGLQHFDAVLVDEHGVELVRVEDFAGRILRDATQRAEPAHAGAAELSFYELAWERRAADAASRAAPALLVFAEAPGLADRLAAAARWDRVVEVLPGAEFQRGGADRYTLDPLDREGYRRLLGDLARDGVRSLDVAHLWGMATEPLDVAGAGALQDIRARLDRALDTGVFSLLHLVHALAASEIDGATRCAYVHPSAAGRSQPEHELVVGLARSTATVLPPLELCTVMCDRGAATPDRLVGVVTRELCGAGQRRGAEIRYDGDGRWIRRVRRLDGPAEPSCAPPLRACGVYLVTGGMSGIGLAFARHLATRYRARLVLLARSPLTDARRADLHELERLGAEVLAVHADVAVAGEVEQALAAAKERYGRLDGVFHAAGVADDVRVTEAERADFERVLVAKTHGTVNLDVLTREEPLELFVMFSSLSAVVGDLGAGSYAAANRFMDAYATQREHWAQEGRRSGRTLALDWPMWSIGGLDASVGEDEMERYVQTTGMTPLTPAQGLGMFERAWSFAAPRLIPALGDRDRIGRALGEPGVEAVMDAGEREARPEHPPLMSALVDHLKRRLSQVLKLAPSRLDETTTLDAYGLDSVMVMEANALLGRDIPGLRATLFFEYRTIADLARHMLGEHAGAVARLLGATRTATARSTPPPPVPRADPGPSEAPGVGSPVSDDIAIVGISGRYPKARDLDEFWANLRAGRDCIEEVPADRWDAEKLFDADPSTPGKSYGRWGGFLADVDMFDSLFFQISPLQAKSMDPQERLFLETAWAALEDAGYTLNALPRARFGLEGRDVGVFVGVMWDDYATLGAEASFRGEHVVTPANRAGIANHVSYFGDFRGPSVVIDTACSSSLVALHMACESIRHGECSHAIAGGVNVSAHPLKYVHLSRKAMLARDGRCRSFGAGGSGYVPGEGVGAVVLKRFSQAVADGDHIHAVIKASVVNHGGRTNGLTVPNPRAQQALIEEALAKSGIDPRSIGYVEAHGTGTALGDPIEHTGLQAAFATRTGERHFCALGSAKSAIGHLEGAAGIAGITKVVLQMRHEQLAPSLHAEALNPMIDFDRSAFRVQRGLAEWPRIAVAHGDASVEQPRRASVSAFGATGTNAHVILEEPPRERVADDAPAREGDAEPELVVLSARSEDALRRYALRLARLLRRNGEPGRTPALADVAHTLQVGREAMAVRIAFVARTHDEAADTLEAFARGEGGEHVAHGSARDRPVLADLFTDTEGGSDFLAALVAGRQHAKLAELWASGLAIDWRVVQDARPRPARRVPLPTYPFARERHWLAVGPEPEPANGRRALSAGAPTEHRRTLRPDDPVLRDHVVGREKILPGVSHLDLVLAALDAGPVPQELASVRWLTPVVVDGAPKDLVIAAERADDGLRYEIRGTREHAATVYSRGRLRSTAGAGEPEPLALEEIRASCPRELGHEELYAALRAQGLHYGPFFAAVQQVWVGHGQVLGRLRLASEFGADAQRHPLHPGIVDAALHTVAGLLGQRERPLLPFAAERVELHRAVPLHGYSHATSLGGQRYDVALTDDAGRVCVRFCDVAYREQRDAYEQFSYRPRWVRAPLQPDEPPVDGGDAVLIVAPASADGIAAGIERTHEGAMVRRMSLSADGALDVALDRELARGPLPDVVYVIGATGDEEPPGDLAAVRDRAQRDVVSLFRLAKALDRHGVLSRPLVLKVLTADAFPLGAHDASRPASAGLWGVCSVLGKEYPQLKIACLDVRGSELADAARLIAAEPAAPKPQPASVRGGVRYARRLERMRLAPPGRARFRERGVYMILGGLGVIGFDTSLHLACAYGARLVLVGRSELDARRRAMIAQLERAGGEVLYVACDGADRAAIREAVAQAKDRFGALHGVIHSAMVLATEPVKDLDEVSLRAALSAKLDTGLAIVETVRDEALDFLLFYSSGVAFEGNAGQAGYAAGCCFMDAFATHVARTVRFPVQTIDWGYWHAAGDDEREQALARLVAAGIQPIAAGEGMETVERVLACGVPHVLATKASDGILAAMGIDPAVEVRLRPERVPSLARAVAGAAPVEPGALEEIEAHLRATKELERIGQSLLLGAVQRMGALRDAGERHRRDELREALGVVPAYHRLHRVLLDILALGGYVRLDGDTVVATREVESERARRVIADPEASQRALVAGHPQIEPLASLLLRCLAAFPEVLRGARSHMDVLFPDGSMELAAGIYRGDPIADWHNDDVARTVERCVRARVTADPEARVEILEIGAGTGGTSTAVLAALAPLAAHVRYTYTDLSSRFVRHGRQEFGSAYPFADFKTLDIEAQPEAQGFAPDSFDVVVAANVLHATRDIVHTTSQIKRLLRTNGLVVLNEGTRIQHAITLVFGLTDGWWLFEDADYRLPGSPLLSAATWADVLGCCGFREIAMHELPETAEGKTGQSVIVAESDGAVGVRTAFSDPPRRSTDAGAAAPGPVDTSSRHRAAEGYVRSVFARVLEMSEDDLDPEATFETYGIDSLVVLELNRAFEADFGGLPTTLLFERITIAQLAQYFIAEHGLALRRLLGEPAPLDEPARPDAPDDAIEAPPADLRQAVEQLTDAEVEQVLWLLTR